MTGDLAGLRLIGWCGVGDHGFAIPLFGQHVGANTLYTARCAIPGDHVGTISGFEPVEVDHWEKLGEDLSIAISVGDVWRDVFVWDGAVFVGTPEELWARLEPVQSTLLEKAPLSLLELAISAAPETVAAAGPRALSFIVSRSGDAMARSWRRKFLRQALEVQARRQLALSHNLSSADFRAIDLVEDGGDKLHVSLSGRLQAEASAIEKLIKSPSSFSRLASALSAEVTLEALKPPEVVAFAPRAPTNMPASDHPADAGENRLRLMTLGKRARDIALHINRYNRDRSTHKDAMPTGRWDVVSGIRDLVASADADNPPSAVILIVLDEDDPEAIAETQAISRHLENERRRGSLILAAPALPIRHPSRLFDEHGAARIIVQRCHAVVDTAVARSPAWWGSAKRSLNRRIADIILLAGAACLDARLDERLRAKARSGTAVLEIGLMPLSGMTTLERTTVSRLGSEANWPTSKPSDAPYHLLLSLPGDSFGQPGTTAVAELSESRRRFAEFIREMLPTILGKSPRLRQNTLRALPTEAVPPGLYNTFVFPDDIAAFSIGHVNDNDGMVVLAETPSLTTAVAAKGEGWVVARYTDAATIRGYVGGTLNLHSIPREIDIGPIRSNNLNRKLATRGVDQRDVVRISDNLMQQWLDELPQVEAAKARAAARVVRSASTLQGDDRPDHILTRDFAASRTTAAERLRLMTADQGTGEERGLRRASDLRRSLAPPSQGFGRFALVDGATPPIVVRMSDGEVPVEDLFIVDGDASVPALFQSRLFDIWARTTLPSASSWMARYSVTNTFGGFPIVEPFRIVAQEGEYAALTAGPLLPGLEELTSDLERRVTRALAGRNEGGWKTAYQQVMSSEPAQQLEALLLDAYGLSRTATDVDILKRLQELNQTIG